MSLKLDPWMCLKTVRAWLQSDDIHYVREIVDLHDSWVCSAVYTPRPVVCVATLYSIDRERLQIALHSSGSTRVPYSRRVCRPLSFSPRTDLNDRASCDRPESEGSRHYQLLSFPYSLSTPYHRHISLRDTQRHCSHCTTAIPHALIRLQLQLT